MELERSSNAQRERQKGMLELPQKAVHIGQIEFLDHFFDFHGFSPSCELRACLLRNQLAMVFPCHTDLHNACFTTDAFLLQTIEHPKTFRQNDRIIN